MINDNDSESVSRIVFSHDNKENYSPSASDTDVEAEAVIENEDASSISQRKGKTAAEVAQIVTLFCITNTKPTYLSPRQRFLLPVLPSSFFLYSSYSSGFVK